MHMYHPPGPHWHTECWTSLPLAVGAFFWWMEAYLMPHESVSFLAAILSTPPPPLSIKTYCFAKNSEY